MRGSGLNIVSDESRSWSVWGLNTNVFADGRERGLCADTDKLRSRTGQGYGQLAGRCRRVPATSRILRRKLRGRFVGCCAFCQLDANLDAAYLPSGLLRGLQRRLQDTSRLLRQPLCEYLPVMRKTFPGNCPDTARLEPGECPDDSTDVGRMLCGHCAGTD